MWLSSPTLHHDQNFDYTGEEPGVFVLDELYPDIFQCLQWLLDESQIEGSDYYGTVNSEQIGVSGHSQGGEAALKAGNKTLMGESGLTWVSTVVAMNPYGPGFVKAQGQNGQDA
jgi:hypothetical protein